MDEKQERINHLVRLTNPLVSIVYGTLKATVFVSYNEVSLSLIETINTIGQLLKELGYSDVFVKFS